MSKLLADAVQATSVIQLFRVSVRLYTMQTTLYRELNSYLRRYPDMSDACSEGIGADRCKSDWERMMVYRRWFERMRGAGFTRWQGFVGILRRSA
jgi:hypothetical protein